MVKKLIILALFIIISSAFAMANLNSVKVCDQTYTCGVSDGVCPTTYDPGHRDCTVSDTDCGPNDDGSITAATICGNTYTCGVSDGVCPTNLDISGRICNTCDVDCGTCPAVDCTLMNINVFFPSPGANDQAPTNLVNQNDQVNISATVTGNECNQLSSLKSLSVFVSENDGPCWLNISTTNLNLNGNILSGFWDADFNDYCNDSKVYGITGQLNYEDGTYSKSDATGSFTFRNDGKSLNCDTHPKDCYPRVWGDVNDSNSKEAIKNATINLRNDADIYSYTTSSNGRYWLAVKQGTYLQTISATNYQPYTKTELFKNPSLNKIGEYKRNVYLTFGTSNCEADCTREGSDMCDRTCEGWNNCNFASQETMDLCDPTDALNDGATNQHIKTYQNQKVKCCTGSPQTLTTYNKEISVPSDKKNVITTTRIVTMNGVPVKMTYIAFN